MLKTIIMAEQVENSTQNGNEKTIKQPIHVGGYVVTGKGRLENSLIFKFVRKPNIIHRFFCKVLLGWIWVDDPNYIK